MQKSVFLWYGLFFEQVLDHIDPGQFVVDFRHRLTVVNMNDTPVSIGQIHSFHSYV